jgi:hypothetical protein
MVAKLSDDLVGELERNGDQPLAVENPRTKKLYVLVAMDEFVDSRAPPKVKSSAEAIEWNEELNSLRFALIRKESAGGLAPGEALELAKLQQAADSYLRQVAPMPWDEMQELHSKLLNPATN